MAGVFLTPALQLWAAGGINVSRFYARMFEGAHVSLGRKLHELRGTGAAPVLALPDAGAIPYYSDWSTIDTVGLNEPHIARTGDRTPAYILSQRPDLVIFNSKSRKQFEPRLPWDQALYDAAHRAGMETIRVIGPDFYALWILGHPDSRIARELRRWQRPMPGPRRKPSDFDDAF